MFRIRVFERREDVPEGLGLFGLVIGDRVSYCGHEGTVKRFREPNSLLSSTAEAEVNWGKRRCEWVSVRELVKIGGNDSSGSA